MKIEVHQSGSDTHGELKLRFRLDQQDLQLTRTSGGLLVELEDFRPRGEAGSPGLPARVVRVALPLNTAVTRWSSQSERTVRLTNQPELVTPVQPLCRALDGPGQDPLVRTVIRPAEALPVRPSSMQLRRTAPVEPPPPPRFVLPRVDVYERDARTPRPFARVLATTRAGLIPMVSVEVTPVRLIQGGLLEFASEITLAISYERQEATDSFRPTLHSPSQARRAVELARAMVVNPEAVADLAGLCTTRANEVDYLIITDNFTWTETTVKIGFKLDPTGEAGNLGRAFQRLAEWKARRGLKSRVVTVSDIVGGRYGNFILRSRDLQEVIRNFLKWAQQAWGISWVLLGGDTEIIPMRLAAGARCGFVSPGSETPPPDNSSFWDGASLRMHLVESSDTPTPAATNLLVNPATGDLIPYDWGTYMSPGWHFCTCDTYLNYSPTPTPFIIVAGPESVINAPLQWLFEWNKIPTDLYYASLQGSHYGRPGLHDWDLNNNGVYGQYNDYQDFDGVELHADVSVGRAPVSNEAQANAFVEKVIAYEQFRRPDGSGLDIAWPRHMLLVSANWGNLYAWPVDFTPPDKENYYHAQGAAYSLIQLKVAPNDTRRLVAHLPQNTARILPYDREAATSGRGWFYAKSSSNLTPSEWSLSVYGTSFTFPNPTEWLVVYGQPDELQPEVFIFEGVAADDSMKDQERLRLQVQDELPGVTRCTRIYEDKVDLDSSQATVAPLQELSEDNVRNALNAGPHFVSLSGHGNDDFCCGLNGAMAQQLRNGYQTSIVFADSCLTNRIDADEALSERMIANPNGGAVAYVGNTRYSWICLGDDFQRAFFHGMTTTHHLGLLNDTRLGLLDVVGSSRGYTQWVMFSQNLMGDPEMPLWVPPPPGPEAFNAVWIKSADDRQAVWGWARADFDRKDAELRAQGYQLAKVNAFVLPNVGPCFNGVWLKIAQDRQAVWGWARADFDRRAAELRAQGYGLVEVNAFVVPNVGPCFNAIWVRGAGDRQAVWGLARADFDRKDAELRAQGYKVAQVNAFVLPGVGPCFNAIWLRTTENRHSVWGWTRADFDRKDAELHAQGYALVEVNAFVLPHVGPCFNGVWLKSANEYRTVWGWTRWDFDRLASIYQSQGYRLSEISTYVQ